MRVAQCWSVSRFFGHVLEHRQDGPVVGGGMDDDIPRPHLLLAVSTHGAAILHRQGTSMHQLELHVRWSGKGYDGIGSSSGRNVCSENTRRRR